MPSGAVLFTVMKEEEDDDLSYSPKYLLVDRKTTELPLSKTQLYCKFEGLGETCSLCLERYLGTFSVLVTFFMLVGFWCSVEV